MQVVYTAGLPLELAVFMLISSSESAGYVHGMTDAKVKTIDLYGPQNLEYYLACGRYALRRYI